eukprot:TRINITY_DN2703_c3_g1_i1.p2 TRINITY_DN2703_c3_g1~~TRINITY_DN2703_c3_g1_i1.p2  ORF type:complete len:177 (+),score=72.70 TRINITY_DN2703_c3_g1_i1:53-532(+)
MSPGVFSPMLSREVEWAHEGTPELVASFEKLCGDGIAVGPAGSLYYLRTQMEVADFMDRLFTYLRCSRETLLAARILMTRWAEQTGEGINRGNFFRLMFAAVLAAIKAREDTFFNNLYYAKIWGLDIATANDLETDFLNAISWDLFVSTEDYDAVVRTL